MPLVASFGNILIYRSAISNSLAAFQQFIRSKIHFGADGVPQGFSFDETGIHFSREKNSVLLALKTKFKNPDKTDMFGDNVDWQIAGQYNGTMIGNQIPESISKIDITPLGVPALFAVSEGKALVEFYRSNESRVDPNEKPVFQFEAHAGDVVIALDVPGSNYINHINIKQTPGNNFIGVYFEDLNKA